MLGTCDNIKNNVDSILNWKNIHSVSQNIKDTLKILFRKIETLPPSKQISYLLNKFHKL